MRFPTMWYVRAAKLQSLQVMTVKLLTEQHLEFLSLKGGCTGLSESTLVKMPHCWKSHVGMYNQQSLRSACAYTQSDQIFCYSFERSMTVKLLTEQYLEFSKPKGDAAQA